jgi:hypothetical protein
MEKRCNVVLRLGLTLTLMPRITDAKTSLPREDLYFDVSLYLRCVGDYILLPGRRLPLSSPLLAS